MRRILFIACGPLLIAGLSAQAPAAINVWKVGSPHRGDVPHTIVPAALAEIAGRSGTVIAVEAFPAQGFAVRFLEAAGKGQAPELVVFDNMIVMNGGTTPLGTFAGLRQYSDLRTQLIQVKGALDDFLDPSSGGWVFAYGGARAYRQARELALRVPECPKLPAGSVADRALMTGAVEIAAAYVARDLAALLRHADASRISGFPRNRETVTAGDIQPCTAWGNDRLAFVSLHASYAGETSIGHERILLALRNLGVRWQLLSASRDPISNSRFLTDVSWLAELLARDQPPAAPPAPALLSSPANGRYPQPDPGQRFGTFTWQPSTAGDLIAEIAEFSYDDDARLFVRRPMPPGPRPAIGRVSAGDLWSTRGDWMWRVWSIARSGDLSFSDVRTFVH